MSTGIGYDCHRFASGRPLVLGGVHVEHDRGLEGHSDADVLTHAIIDAMRERLAAALQLDLRHVSVKATRGEGMGFVGREEGIAALAIATVGEL
jgi:2C-methyl-D-erythritol 2,4-cyclodiphosphate synthase